MRIVLRLLGIGLALTALSCQQTEQATSAGPREGTAASADGVPIHYRVTGSGEPTLVFVHGWCCDGTYWDDVVAHFSPRHRIVTVDLAGHGQSGLDRQQWSMAAFGADVRAVVEKLDLDDVVLIGHSMGGAVIVEATLAMPERVRGLVGVDNFQKATIEMPPQMVEQFMAQYRQDFAGTAKPFVRNMFAATADSALVERVADDMAEGPPAVGIGALGAFLDWFGGDSAEALAKLQVPLHCINSDKLPTDTEAMAKLVSDYKLRLMPGCGHFLWLEDPANFNRLLEETLSDFAERG
jgi:pimeloyl-ACP methyl ester carboxylesterase